MLLPKACLFIVAVLGCLEMGCGTVSHAWAEHRDESAASNHMMLVRESPASLGYRRLMTKAAHAEDLKIFVDRTGLPDFMAEADSSDRKYLIFYYLDRHEAFACRTKNGGAGELEFAGPYSMSTGELRLLRAAKDQSEQALAGR